MRRFGNLLRFLCLVASALFLALSIQTLRSVTSASSTADKEQNHPVTISAPAVSERKFGHFAYREASSKGLVLVLSAEPGERLQQEAATAFESMVNSAKQHGVNLHLLSGFRGIAQQEQVFANKIQRSGSARSAALTVAPPGFSEHHTGYALDIGDSQNPASYLSVSFEQSNSFQWLTAHAAEFGFELSFPNHNAQGVSYEPWHWRYVHSPTAIKIFESARKLYSSETP